MATVVSPPEQRIVLDNITWDVYEQLLATHRDRSVPRFTYDRGSLEITSPSAEHEELKHMIALFVEVIEVWRYDGRQWQIFHLVGEEYIKQVQSTAFPGLTEEVMTVLLDESRSLERLVWL